VIIESSGSDANVDAILGRVFWLKSTGKTSIKILTSSIEHSSIEYLTKTILPLLGVIVVRVMPDKYGQITL
jgi:cysteine sulfinate desulfinase/cysteine desulfurase-like protein